MAGIEAPPRQSATFGKGRKICGVMKFKGAMLSAAGVLCL
jgi:hypothetical protein